MGRYTKILVLVGMVSSLLLPVTAVAQDRVHTPKGAGDAMGATPSGQARERAQSGVGSVTREVDATVVGENAPRQFVLEGRVTWVPAKGDRPGHYVLTTRNGNRTELRARLNAIRDAIARAADFDLVIAIEGEFVAVRPDGSQVFEVRDTVPLRRAARPAEGTIPTYRLELNLSGVPDALRREALEKVSLRLEHNIGKDGGFRSYEVVELNPTEGYIVFRADEKLEHMLPRLLGSGIRMQLIGEVGGPVYSR